MCRHIQTPDSQIGHYWRSIGGVNKPINFIGFRGTHLRAAILHPLRQQVSRIVAWPMFDSGKVRGASGYQTPNEAADEF
jgi:hypothetical protein